ncbi:hypothetical protein QMA60_09450 [Leuconostoc suionicum]|uniref:hypothetical protein n=1 Tax=Leuconostoc suionicum TaxID=1511761 RepID=UPI0024ADDBBB|nr:hypothetical protein [Leuconostoc suionicum]MDI6498753.1 hypothetical protein [Leuconostoc suionicum]MDI6500805.1 hypothetical protein [Leuconostoc suionicum]MDI6502963.1 hypothetical protein [Leuconostoc suionicum]MDI6614741.1 hypothetical protein [Leuconostoc suionicum]MDI6665840.1 hypothetical protein [Leuconostoc suionicum]
MKKVQFEQKLKDLTKQLTIRKFILFIASALLIMLICLLLFVFHLNQSSVSHSETSQSSSQVTNQPSEGKDYTIQYSNSSVIKRSTLNTALKKAGLFDFIYLLNTSDDGGNDDKILIYYNQTNQQLVFKFYQNGYQSDKDYQIGGYDLQKQTAIHGLQPSAFNGLPLVYTWENLQTK